MISSRALILCRNIHDFFSFRINFRFDDIPLFRKACHRTSIASFPSKIPISALMKMTAPIAMPIQIIFKEKKEKPRQPKSAGRR